MGHKEAHWCVFRGLPYPESGQTPKRPSESAMTLGRGVRNGGSCYPPRKPGGAAATAPGRRVWSDSQPVAATPGLHWIS
jgi:hypothetical protein